MSRKTSKVVVAEEASEVDAALLTEKVEAEAATRIASEAAAVDDALIGELAEAAEVDIVAAAKVASTAAVAVLHSGGTLQLSDRAVEYLSVLLAQHFGAATVEENDAWRESVESGNQVLVRSGPLQLEITDVPFVIGDASTDLTGGNILLNVHRQLADVRLLD